MSDFPATMMREGMGPEEAESCLPVDDRADAVDQVLPQLSQNIANGIVRFLCFLSRSRFPLSSVSLLVQI